MVRSDPNDLLTELSRLENLRSGDSKSRRRRHPRFVVRGQAELLQADCLSANDEGLSVMLRDMGRGGLGFIADRPVAIDSVWELRFIQRAYRVGETNVVVRHCEQVKDEVYLVGCQVCMGNGLIYLLGVDPEAVGDGDGPAIETDSAAFLPPGEIA